MKTNFPLITYIFYLKRYVLQITYMFSMLHQTLSTRKLVNIESAVSNTGLHVHTAWKALSEWYTFSLISNNVK